MFYFSSYRARYLNRVLLSLLLLPGLGDAAESVFTHVHLSVPDRDQAAAWHQALFGGERHERGPGPALLHDNGFVMTRLVEAAVPPSRGGAIDHIGFSVADVAGKLEEARGLGARVLDEPAERNGRLSAMIEDPWGTSIELLEDPEYPGLHHVHIMSEEPETLRDWFLSMFGGVHDPNRDRPSAQSIRYGNFWVSISAPGRDDVTRSRGRSIDHMGWRIPDMGIFIEQLEAAGYSPDEVRPNEDGSTLLFFEGAGGVYFEMAQPPK